MLGRIGRATTRTGLVVALSCTTPLVGLSATAGAKTATVKVEINDDGCPAKLTITAGPTNFKVSNTGSGDVSEFEVLSDDRIIGEVENVAPGLNKEFSLTLKPGTYATACPGGSKHSKGKLVVTGTAATKLSADGKAAVDQYRAYLETQSAELVTATKAFTDAVDRGDLEQAKAAARRSSPVVSSNAWPSRGRWRIGPSSSWPTSPPATRHQDGARHREPAARARPLRTDHHPRGDPRPRGCRQDRHDLRDGRRQARARSLQV